MHEAGDRRRADRGDHHASSSAAVIEIPVESMSSTRTEHRGVQCAQTCDFARGERHRTAGNAWRFAVERAQSKARMYRVLVVDDYPDIPGVVSRLIVSFG